VVLEGVSVTRAAAAGRYAYRVWVDAPRDLRLERGVARDGEDQRPQGGAWQAMEDEFFALDGTRARADLRIETG
jgi:uridine kinase